MPKSPDEYRQQEQHEKGVTGLSCLLISIAGLGLVSCAGMVYGVFLIIGEAVSGLDKELPAIVTELQREAVDSARRATDQIAEIEIPDQLVPLFGSGGAQSEAQTSDESQGTNNASEDLIAVYITLPTTAGSIEDLQNDNGHLVIGNLPQEKSIDEILNHPELRGEIRDFNVPMENAGDTTELTREIRGKPAIFSLSREKVDELGGADAWSLIGFFQGKGGPAFLLMVIRAELITEEEIMQMVDSIH